MIAAVAREPAAPTQEEVWLAVDALAKGLTPEQVAVAAARRDARQDERDAGARRGEGDASAETRAPVAPVAPRVRALRPRRATPRMRARRLPARRTTGTTGATGTTGTTGATGTTGGHTR